MSYKIVAKYIKDINFQIADTRTFFLLSKNISNYNLNIDIKSNQVKEKIIEVGIILSLIPLKESVEKIDIKISHSTVVELDSENLEKKKLEKIILVEIPTIVYPEIKETLILLFSKSGFKDLKFEKSVNFEELYKKRKIQ
tara:strand:+ start:634 stop:1053 length:420 start_codon:yes stop_codon:yes gene_type:complete